MTEIMPEYRIRNRLLVFGKEKPRADLTRLMEEDIIGVPLSTLVKRFHDSMEGREFSWGKKDQDRFNAVVRVMDSGLRGLIKGCDYALTFFPTAEERIKRGGEIQLTGESGPRESMYLGGELTGLDQRPAYGRPVVTPGAIGKVHDIPCIFEGQPSLFLYYSQYNPGFFRVHDNRLRKLMKPWLTKGLPVIEEASKATEFKSIIAMGPDQIKEEDDRINDDIINLSYVTPYERNEFKLEKITLPIGGHTYKGRYWVKRFSEK